MKKKVVCGAAPAKVLWHMKKKVVCGAAPAKVLLYGCGSLKDLENIGAPPACPGTPPACL